MKGLWNWFLIKILLISTVTAVKDQIILEAVYLPVIFGESAHLLCNLSLVPDCCSNRATWMANLDVIIHHGASVNSSKYVQSNTREGFVLQIRHFGETDLYVKYSCLYEFYTVSKVLEVDENKYEKRPTDENTKIAILFEKEQAVRITFEEVFPLPKCHLFNDQTVVSSQYEIQQQRVGIFYNTSLDIGINENTGYCRGAIMLLCFVGTFEKTWNLNKIISCPDVNLEKKNDVHRLVLISSLLIIFIIAFFIFGSVIVTTIRNSSLKDKGPKEAPQMPEDVSLCPTGSWDKIQESKKHINNKRRYHHDIGSNDKNSGDHIFPVGTTQENDSSEMEQEWSRNNITVSTLKHESQEDLMI